MLKTSLFSPAFPRRAETRFPHAAFLLRSQEPKTCFESPCRALFSRAGADQLWCRFHIPHRGDVNGFPCEFGFCALGILIDDSLVHHASFLVILDFGVSLPKLERRRRKFLAHRIVGHHIVKGLQGFLIAP